MVHRMIHELKYKDNQAIGERLGFLFGQEMMESKRMRDFDLIMPVPLHPRKEKIRGYNQSLCIARGLKDALRCELSSGNLVRNTFTTTQTRKGRFERWQNVGSIFSIRNPELLQNKNILLIDDVITTGATIEACVHVLKEISVSSISVAALAYPV